jgi:trimethylamine--corrinoid protein Co-methyltransferase
MISGLKSLCVPTYQLLTPEQIKSFHTATLELLETVGVDVHHDEARQMLADAGCRLKENHRVRIPNWLVEAAIQSARPGSPSMTGWAMKPCVLKADASIAVWVRT